VRTEGEIDPRSRMVHAVARVDDPYGEAVDGRAPLHVGLFVDAEIEGRTLPAAAVLPREALREGDRVLVVDGDDRLRFRAVQVARLTREHVIVGAGLAAGERVCISPRATPVDGMAVRVARDAPESAS
jgi:multidrug efflux pump subunit AcrA (membrane-fusion protein)